MSDSEHPGYKNVTSDFGTLDFNGTFTFKFLPLDEIITILVTSCSPAVICFNIFLLYLAYKYVNFNQNVEQIFVVNMTFADLMFGSTYMIWISRVMQLPSWMCKSFYVAIWTFNMASVHFLLLLNVYKFVILFFPVYSLSYKSSKSKIATQTCLVWIAVVTIAVSFSFEPTFVHILSETYSCLVFFDYKMYAILVMCFYIVPLSVSLVLSICIFGFAQIRSVRRRRREPPDFVDKWKQTFGRVIFVFTSTLWASLTHLPYRIHYFRLLLCRYDTTDSKPFANSFDGLNNKTQSRRNVYEHSCNQSVAESFLLVVLAFGFVVNPLITIFTQRIYRERAVEIFLKMIRCCKKHATVNR